MEYNPANVKSIYLGRDKICRCGCAGDYVERGEPKFEQRLKRFAKMWCTYIPQKHDYVEGEYINVSYGKDRAMTVYFN